MIKKSILLLFLNVFICLQSWTQNSIIQPKGRMERQADSTSAVIDSLISSGTILHLIIEYRQESDTTYSNRHYFIDSVHGYLVKAIVDTTIQDYYKRPIKQAVIYFNQGYLFKNCFNVTKDIPTSFCSYYNTYPEANEIAQQLGKLNIDWNSKGVDEIVKNIIRKEIFWMKFMQKKYSKND